LGDGKKDRGSIQKSPLDALCQTVTGGNTGLISNEVLLLGYRSAFQNTLSGSSLSCRALSSAARLDDVLPWGRLKADGKPVLLNPSGARGMPLVAVSSDTDAVASCCEALPPGKGVVVADNVTALVNNLQDYDRIADSQSLLVFCSPDDLDKAFVLSERGAVVWEVHPDESASGMQRCEADELSIFGRVLSRLEVLNGLNLSVSQCRSDDVEALARVLEVASDYDRESDDAEQLDALLKPLFGWLNSIVELVDSPPEETLFKLKKRTDKIRRDFNAASAWIRPEHQTPIRDALEIADRMTASASGASGEAKGISLLSFVQNIQNGGKTAVVTKSPEAARSLSDWLGENSGVEAYAISGMPEKRFDHIVMFSWPGRYLASRLIHSYMASEIRLIGYPHECRWFERLISRLKAEHKKAGLTSNDRSRILGIQEAPALTSPWEKQSVGSGLLPGDTSDKTVDAVLEYEARLRTIRPSVSRDNGTETREAKFVRFVGSSSSFFTEWHSVPVLNSLLSEGETGRGVPSRYPNDLQVGDFLLFREGADKDVVRYVAEAEVTEAKYQRIRQVADMWRPALEAIARDPWTVWTRLRDQGLTKGEATVRGWMLDTYRIGPGSASDYEIIATVSPDPQFKSRWREVWEAVRKVRRMHIRAGHNLSRLLLGELPKHLDEIGMKETSIDLGFGQVWIVQVEYIADGFENVPYTAVNRLLWDEEEAPLPLLTLDDLDLDL